MPTWVKFPGPFPVASIRLKYVARPAAAERFVAREGDGDGDDASKAASTAPDEDGDMTIPEVPGEVDAGSELPLTEPEDARDRFPHQGELEFVPLPGEDGNAEPDAGPAKTEDGKTSESVGKAPDVDGAAPAQAPQNDAPDAGSEPAIPPRSSDAGGGRGSEWL